MDERALSPVIGIVLMVGLTLVLAATVGTVVFAPGTEQPAKTVRLSASADGNSDTITVTHEGGDSLDVERIDLRILINGQPLDHQPPVPFFAARGFNSGPTGPFNSRTTGPWTAGESGSLTLASTNAPDLNPGDTVEITVTSENDVLASLEITAE